LQYIL